MDVDVLEGVDAQRRLLDLTADRLREELLDEVLEVDRRRLAGHDLEHFPPDLPDLGGLRVRRLAHLRRPALRESDGEETEEVAVGRLHVYVCLDEGLPLAH